MTRHRRPISMLLLAAALAVFSLPAQGQGRFCDSRAAVLDHLAKKYGESVVSLGLAANGSVLELLTSAGGATWTILVTTPNGRTCLFASGESWAVLPPKVDRLVGQGL